MQEKQNNLKNPTATYYEAVVRSTKQQTCSYCGLVNCIAQITVMAHCLASVQGGGMFMRKKTHRQYLTSVWDCSLSDNKKCKGIGKEYGQSVKSTAVKAYITIRSM